MKLYLLKTELFEIKLFCHLTVCKQNYTYTKLNYLNYNRWTKVNNLK